MTYKKSAPSCQCHFYQGASCRKCAPQLLESAQAIVSLIQRLPNRPEYEYGTWASYLSDLRAAINLAKEVY